MKLSICVITYNHSKYIKQAVESILSQQTTFDYELIISNDCSTDNTDEIINDIIKTNPNGSKIKYFNHKKNLGMLPNFLFVLDKCKGEYVALCDGDDYWTDENKLQKQVDFLDANHDYSICFHKVNVLSNNIEIEDVITQEVAETTSIKDLAMGNYIHTVSVVYRNHLFASFPKYFRSALVGDYFLHLLNARFGKIKCMDQTMGVYRLHTASSWSKLDQAKRNKIWVKFLRKISPSFDKDIQEILGNQIRIISEIPIIKKKNIVSRLWKKIKVYFRK